MLNWTQDSSFLWLASWQTFSFRFPSTNFEKVSINVNVSFWFIHQNTKPVNASVIDRKVFNFKSFTLFLSVAKSRLSFVWVNSKAIRWLISLATIIALLGREKRLTKKLHFTSALGLFMLHNNQEGKQWSLTEHFARSQWPRVIQRPHLNWRKAMQ